MKQVTKSKEMDCINFTEDFSPSGNIYVCPTKPTRIEELMITSFTGENSFLSNFYISPVTYNGHTYMSVEHAYQAAKAKTEEDRLAIANCDTPGKAKRLGRKIEMREDFEENKVEIMKECLMNKFSNPNLRKKLVSTGKVYLAEGNNWGDTYWGVLFPDLVGENRLGKLLMEIRHLYGILR